MARIGLLNGIHGQGTDGVGELTARGHGDFFHWSGAVLSPMRTGPSISGPRSRFARNRRHTIAVRLCSGQEFAAMTQFTVVRWGLC
jgi:hypothetical protein